jgi:transposase-like protein
VTTLVPPGKTYTQEQKDAALALYETDGPTAVEKQLGIPKNTVAGWARKAGTRTVRPERVRAAVEAKVADGKLRRASIVQRLYGRTEKILDRLEADTYTWTATTKEGTETVYDIEPPAADERSHATAIAIYLDKATKLEDYDRSGEESGAAVDKWLEFMMGGNSGG